MICVVPGQAGSTLNFNSPCGLRRRLYLVWGGGPFGVAMPMPSKHVQTSGPVLAEPRSAVGGRGYACASQMSSKHFEFILWQGSERKVTHLLFSSQDLDIVSADVTSHRLKKLCTLRLSLFWRLGPLHWRGCAQPPSGGSGLPFKSYFSADSCRIFWLKTI